MWVTQAFSHRSAVPANCKRNVIPPEICLNHLPPRIQIYLLPSAYIPVWVIQPSPCWTFISAPQNSEAASVSVGWGGGRVGSDSGEGGIFLCTFFISFIVLLLQTLPYWLGRLLTDIYLTDIYLLTLVFEFRDMIMWTWQQIICNCIDCWNLKICNIS